MIDEHAVAVLAALNGVSKPAAIRIDDGRTPNPLPDVHASPYALVYFDSNDPESTKEAQPYQFTLTATVHSVAANAAAVRQVADWVRSALLMQTLTVAGRSCYPITREAGVPPRRDESTGSLVMDQVDTYVLRSIPG